MNDALIAALSAILVALLALVGTIFTASTSRKSAEAAANAAAERVGELAIYRIGQLEKKQDKHNQLIEWRAEAEARLKACEEAIRKDE